MSEAFMPAAEGPPGPLPQEPPPGGGGMPPELAAAMGGGAPAGVAPGAGPGGADTAIPPELAEAMGGGGEEPMEPASLEAAMEHIRMGMQMLQELQVGSEDEMELADLGGMMAPVQKMLADRQKKEIVKSASG